MFDEQGDAVFPDVYLEIETLKFVEIGVGKDHAHFWVQSAQTYSVTKLMMLIKSLTVREVVNCS